MLWCDAEEHVCYKAMQAKYNSASLSFYLGFENVHAMLHSAVIAIIRFTLTINNRRSLYVILLQELHLIQAFSKSQISFSRPHQFCQIMLAGPTIKANKTHKYLVDVN